MPLRVTQDINQALRAPITNALKKSSNTSIECIEKKGGAIITSGVRSSSLSDATFDNNETTSDCVVKHSLNSGKSNQTLGISRKMATPSIVKVRRTQPSGLAKKPKTGITSKKDQQRPVEVSDSLSLRPSLNENALSNSSVSTSGGKQRQRPAQQALPCAPVPFKNHNEVAPDDNKSYDTKETPAKVPKKQPRAFSRSVSAQPIFTEKSGKEASPTGAAKYKVGVISRTNFSVIPGNTGHHTEQLDEMEAVMGYIKHISDALARRTRSLPPPEHLDTFRATITPQSRKSSLNSERNVGDHANSMLSSLQEAATTFLSWFSKVEYLNVSQDESLRNLELQTLKSGAWVLGLVEAVERNFLTHEVSVVREAFFSKGGCLAVTECRELIDAMTQTAQHIVLLRQLVHERDLFCVRDLFEIHKDTIKKRLESASSKRSVKYQEEMLKGPFFSWLERRWLPAMRSWRRIVLEARQLAASGDLQAALAHSQKETFSVAALQDILGPGETIQDLHKTQIEIPILELSKELESKQKAMNALRVAMQSDKIDTDATATETRTCLDVIELEKAINSCRDALELGKYRGPVNEQMGKLLSEAKQLLLDLREVEKTRQALAVELATDSSGGGVPLFLLIHRANELIHRLHLAESVSDAHNIVSSCRTAVTKFMDADTNSCRSKSSNRHSTQTASLMELLPPNITIFEVSLAHMPSSVWPASMVTLYQQACSRLVELFTHEKVRREYARRLSGAAPVPLSPMGEITNAPNLAVVRKANVDEETSAFSESTIRKYNTSFCSAPSEQSTSGLLQTQLRHVDNSGYSSHMPVESRASSTQLRTLKLKVHFEGQTRIVHVREADTASFEDVSGRLYKQCCELFAILHRSQASSPPDPRRLRIRYEDGDGDYITLLNDEDWCIMLSELRFASMVNRASVGDAPQGVTTKLEVHCDFILLPEENATDPTRASMLSTGSIHETSVECFDTASIGDGITNMNDESVSCAPSRPPMLAKKREKLPQESPAMMRLEALKRNMLSNAGEKTPLPIRKGGAGLVARRSRSAQPMSNPSARSRETGGRAAAEWRSSPVRRAASPRHRGARGGVPLAPSDRDLPRTPPTAAAAAAAAATPPLAGRSTPSPEWGAVPFHASPLPPSPLVSSVVPSAPSPETGAGGEREGERKGEGDQLVLHTNKRWDQDGEDEIVLEMQTVASASASTFTCVTTRGPAAEGPRPAHGASPQKEPEGKEKKQGERLEKPSPPPPLFRSSPSSSPAGASAAGGGGGVMTPLSLTGESRGVAPSTRPPLPYPRRRPASPMGRTRDTPCDANECPWADGLSEAMAARHRDPNEVLQEMCAMREENQRALNGRKHMWQHDRM